MPVYLCGQGPGGGHPSISDDGSGNVVVADGKRILGDGGTALAPFIAIKSGSGLSTGLVLSGASVLVSSAGTFVFSAHASAGIAITKKATFSGQVVFSPTATQVVDVALDTVLVNGEHLKIDQQGAVTSLAAPFMAAGTDGQEVLLEFIGAGTLTLRDHSSGVLTGLKLLAGASQACANGDMLFFRYSDQEGAWCQLGAKSDHV